MDFGKQLKNAREAKDLTLQQIARELKINLNVLKKIESSDAGALPNATSTKGFLKSYAHHIDIDPQPVIEDYLERLDVKEIAAKDTVLKDAVDPSPFFLSVFIKKKVLPVLFLLCILGVGLVSYKYLSGVDELFSKTFEFPVAKKNKKKNNSESANSNKTKSSQETKSLNENQQVAKDQSNLKTESEAKALDGKPKEDARVIQEDVKLIIEPLAKTYAYYKDQNSNKAITLSLKPNVKRSFTFKEAEITFLDSGAVNLILDGKDLGSPGIFAERKTIKFPSLEGL